MKFFWYCAIVLSLMFGWYWYRDPLSSLNKGGVYPIQLVEEKSYSVQDGEALRIYRDYTFNSGPYGELRFTISLPDSAKEGGIPCAIIVDGLETGQKSLTLIEGHGEYALIAFEYPKILHKFKALSVFLYLFSIRKAALCVPGQIMSLVHWVQSQHWYNKEPVSVMGFSFGSEFIPALYHLAETQKISLGPAVLAYGGAGLFRLFYAFPGNFFVKFLRGLLGEFLFRPLEPERHLPAIHGEFLILNGVYDQQIPLKAAQKLQNLVPEPKTILNLQTPHLKPKSDLLLQNLIKIAREWLEERRSSIERRKKSEEN